MFSLGEWKLGIICVHSRNVVNDFIRKKDNLSFFINELRKHSGIGYTIDKTADREGAPVSDKGEKSFDILVLNQESDRNRPEGLEKDKQYILILYKNNGKEGELLMPSLDFKKIISMDLAVFKEKSRRNKTFLLNAMEAVAHVCKEPDLQEIVREMKKVNEKVPLLDASYSEKQLSYYKKT